MCPDLEWSLPRPLYKEKSHKNILFMPKRPRLVIKISSPDFECIRKPDKNPSGLSPFKNQIVRISDVDCIDITDKDLKSKGEGYSQHPPPPFYAHDSTKIK
jgi:hypothetical protein